MFPCNEAEEGGLSPAVGFLLVSPGAVVAAGAVVTEGAEVTEGLELGADVESAAGVELVADVASTVSAKHGGKIMVETVKRTSIELRTAMYFPLRNNALFSVLQYTRLGSPCCGIMGLVVAEA